MKYGKNEPKCYVISKNNKRKGVFLKNLILKLCIFSKKCSQLHNDDDHSPIRGFSIVRPGS